MEIIANVSFEKIVGETATTVCRKTILSGKCETEGEAYISIHRQCMSICHDMAEETGEHYDYVWFDEERR